jgi:hypothetical protein
MKKATPKTSDRIPRRVSPNPGSDYDLATPLTAPAFDYELSSPWLASDDRQAAPVSPTRVHCTLQPCPPACSPIEASVAVGHTTRESKATSSLRSCRLGGARRYCCERDDLASKGKPFPPGF